MIGMKSLRVVIVVVIALMSAGCSEASVPSGSAQVPTPPAPTSTTLATNAASAPAATPEPTPGVAFRALDTPAGYSKSGADAVDGTTAVGWVQVGIADEHPAVWDTTTGALQVLAVPATFVHPSGDTFVRLVGVSGTTAVGTGTLGTEGKRGQERAMAWNTETGALRILDIPAGFTQAEAHAISGTTAVGQVWTGHGEVMHRVAWDTETGAVRILKMPAGYDCGNPHAISGDSVVGSAAMGTLAFRWSGTRSQPMPETSTCSRRPKTAIRTLWTARRRSANAASARRGRPCRWSGIPARARCASSPSRPHSKTVAPMVSAA